jgi:hypothetical protein
LASRCAERFSDNIDPSFLVVVFCFQSTERLDGSQKSNTTARKDAFLDRGAGVACMASSTRSLRSFTSTSVAPPTRIHRHATGELG